MINGFAYLVRVRNNKPTGIIVKVKCSLFYFQALFCLNLKKMGFPLSRKINSKLLQNLTKKLKIRCLRLKICQTLKSNRCV